MKIKIYHISDLHGHYLGMARISTALKEHGTLNSIILDGGNNVDFKSFETEGSKGEISSALLNEIGFTSRVFADNEVLSGLENCRVMSESSNFPVVTCNMYQLNGQKIDYLKDYMIVTIHGINILIIGVTSNANQFYHLYGISVRNPQQEIERVLKEVAKDEYDLVLVLSHLGIAKDKEIAKQLNGIDMIIDGHSQTSMEKPAIINKTIICNSRGFEGYIGKLVLEFDINKKIIGYTWNSVEYNLFPPDHMIYHLIDKYSRLADINLTKTLYNVKADLNHSLSAENQLGNLVADGLKDFLKTEIGLINSGILNHGIKAGIISNKLLLELCPSPFHPTYLELKGKDLLRVLEKSLLPEYYNALGPGEGFRGRSLGNISVSANLVVTYQNNNDPMKKVIDVQINRKPLEPEKWYSIGTSDYLTRRGGYEEFDNCRNINYQPNFLREILAKYLKKWRFIRKSKQKRFYRQD